MALNIEFDFIRREIVVGGLAGSWFVHLSAALVSGLFFSTALTLIMVPVMVTAPKVIGGSFGRFFRWVGSTIGGLFRGRRTAITPEGETVEIPDSTGRYIQKPGEAEREGPRQAAE
jgi:multidrug efflux pump